MGGQIGGCGYLRRVVHGLGPWVADGDREMKVQLETTLSASGEKHFVQYAANIWY